MGFRSDVRSLALTGSFGLAAFAGQTRALRMTGSKGDGFEQRTGSKGDGFEQRTGSKGDALRRTVPRD